MYKKANQWAGYHGHRRFYAILEELAELHSKKNHDYAKHDDPLFNFRLCEQMGIPAWKGILVRISDKLSRLMMFAQKGELEVSDEAVEDTFRDLAVYAILGLILYEETRDAN